MTLVVVEDNYYTVANGLPRPSKPTLSLFSLLIALDSTEWIVSNSEFISIREMHFNDSHNVWFHVASIPIPGRIF